MCFNMPFSKFDQDLGPLCQFTFFCHLENYFHLNIIATRDCLKDQNICDQELLASNYLVRRKENLKENLTRCYAPS
jgi:hypothetical protein